MEVGVRELRNNLSRYLHHVRDGEDVVVTDRGRAVARLVPVSGERRIDRLVAEGVVDPARHPKKQPLTRPLPVEGTVSDLVGKQRR